MKIGYPGINQALGCTPSHTFRLSILSEQKFIETAQLNLDCLMRILEWNAQNNIFFFRIGSNVIPFASHREMNYPWQDIFRDQLAKIGAFIRDHNMRISMHPGQFVVLNSPSDTVYANSIAELEYHADLMDLLGLDDTNKFQVHLGGWHGDQVASTALFLERYGKLPEKVRRRLVIENDERFATVDDCYALFEACGIPTLFDTLHHEVNNTGLTIQKGLAMAMRTWSAHDGTPMIDYSTQNPEKRVGAHAITLDVEVFRRFLRALKGKDIDIMLEIKNKEASAIQAVVVSQNL